MLVIHPSMVSVGTKPLMCGVPLYNLSVLIIYSFHKAFQSCKIKP